MVEAQSSASEKKAEVLAEQLAEKIAEIEVLKSENKNKEEYNEKDLMQKCLEHLET